MKGVKLSLKVFWREVSEEEELSQLLEDPGVEELVLPAEGVAELRDCLVGSADILPSSSRTFREWQVGLLEKGEGGK